MEANVREDKEMSKTSAITTVNGSAPLEDPVDTTATTTNEKNQPPHSLQIFPSPRNNSAFIKFSITQTFLTSHPLKRSLPSRHNMMFKFDKSPILLLQSLLFAHGFNEAGVDDNNFNILWMSGRPGISIIRNLKPHQRVNHFLKAEQIILKHRLCINIQRMQESKGFRHFNIIPKTFILPAELSLFQETFRKLEGVWIVKPCSLSRGRGIYLINHYNQLCADESVVVSRYIEPLCINGFKFDLRLYVAVTSYNPLRIYLYKEGLGRFATERYQQGGADLTNLCMHLTNYSINKLNPNFVSSENGEVEDFGNKWSMSAVLRYLKDNGYNVEKLMMSVEDIIIKTIISGEFYIVAASRNFQPHHGNCFELFGFDILIDESLQPWVLEVNLSPSLACDTPLDLKIKSHLISDLLSLVGVPLITNNDTTTNLIRSHSFSTLSSSLSSEGALVLAHTKEEYKRRGQFMRIFPSEDSWELYGYFLENKTQLNYIIHRHLYPDNSKIKWPPCQVVPIETVINRRLKKVEEQSSLNKKNGPKGMSAMQRAAVYLKQLDTSKTDHVVGSGRNFSKLEHYSLTKFQVRILLAAYLENVYQRLLVQSKKCCDQLTKKELLSLEINLDQIEQFMIQIDNNLISPVNTVLSTDKFDNIIDRCRKLAKKLIEIVFAFKAETTVLQSKLDSEDIISGGETCTTKITNNSFKDFIAKASEIELEQLLMKYKSDKSLVTKLSLVKSGINATTGEQNLIHSNVALDQKKTTKDNTAASQKLIPLVGNKSKPSDVTSNVMAPISRSTSAIYASVTSKIYSGGSKKKNVFKKSTSNHDAKTKVVPVAPVSKRADKTTSRLTKPHQITLPHLPVRKVSCTNPTAVHVSTGHCTAVSTGHLSSHGLVQ